MQMINNEVRLCGRLGHSIELKKSTSGNSVVNFSIAVDSGKDSAGQKITDWIDCKAFGKTADLLAEYTHKGDEILVCGRLSVNKWEDRNGQKRRSTDVLIGEFRNMSPRERKAPEPASYDQPIGITFNEDDMPF